MAPGKNTFHALGVLVLVAAALGIVAAIVFGILASRTAYFEQRNLRELDRIAAELTATKDNLAQTATLHFVPRQLHFSLSPQLECLSATTQIMGARQQPINIVYYFTDPSGSSAIAEWYADHAPRGPAAGSPGAPGTASLALPNDICGYQRPLGRSVNDETVTLGGDRILLARTARLTSLLWPMTMQGDGRPQDNSGCLENPPTSNGGGEVSDLRSFVRNCFLQAAVEDLEDEDQGYSYRERSEFETVAGQSIDAAMRSNTIRINVSTATEALDLGSALDFFDAVQVIGSDARNGERPILLHQAGRVPAAIEGDETDEARVLSTLTSLAGTPAGRAAAQRIARPGREGDFLAEARVIRTGDLILFQRTVPRLAGLHCSPCRIVGIVERGKFNETVRKVGGVQATAFLIGILSLIGLIPLIQLKLRKRLDAVGRVGQYIVWFALALLAASASVSTLAIWSSSASRNAGATYAGQAIRTISEAFNDELRSSIPLIDRIGSQLAPSQAVFPAPDTLPHADQLDGQSSALDRRSQVPVIRTLATAWDGGTAAIIENVSYYRGDGFLDRGISRVATGRTPAFGISLADRPYFVRARNRDYDSIVLPQCGGGREGTRFILDRVFVRNDGAPRVIWVMPAKRACQAAAQPSPQTPAPGGATPQAAANIAPDYGEDRQTYYDPTHREFLVASGTLRTFLGASLAPGFSYAVVAPDRNGDEPNVLFHSRPGAALVERFQHEIDDPQRFEALVAQALAPSDGPADAAQSSQARAAGALRMDTNYRARSSRLTVARLHPDTDWILVIVEDRDDAGFAIWRAATFGYAMWFVGALFVALVIVIRNLLNSSLVDRRPGLSLWPRDRLASFTPPQFERKADMERRLILGAAKRDRHLWQVLVASLIGVAAGEGASRVVLAYAGALTALAARAYFQGMTTEDDAKARRSNCWLILVSFAVLALAVIVFKLDIFAEYRFRAAVAQRVEQFDWSMLARVLVFSAAALLLAWRQFTALVYTFDVLPLPEAPPEREVRLGRRLSKWLKGLVSKVDAGWMAMLIVLGSIPAMAGFLDSYDQDRFLLAERAEQVGHLARETRRQEILAINLARVAKLPTPLINQVIDRPVAFGSPQDAASASRSAPPAISHPGFDLCNSLSCFAIFYLDLREQALEFSDFAPFRMGFGTDGALSGARGYSRSIPLPLVAAIPFLLLILALIFFKRQYFHQPPILSPGKDPDFDPPLSFTRRDFIAKALLPAARGEKPVLPFKPAGGNRHLILGIGMELRDEWATGKGKRLVDVPGIEWVDLLELEDPPKADAAAKNPDTPDPAVALKSEPGHPAPDDAGSAPPAEPQAKVVVFGNLDLALQVQDEGRTGDRAFRAIKDVSDARGPGCAERHVFVLADIDPLDRIALLWEQHDREEATSLIKGWRWAELIEDFTLFPIRHDGRIQAVTGDGRVLRTIREELGVLDIGFARELRDRLVERLKRRRGSDERADADRIVSFISEQMSDYYQKLWASSSDEERVMLYRLAKGCHLKLQDSRGLRSLLARGLLVRVPEYRLINRSFAHYVCRVGATSGIRRSAERVGGLDRIWPLIRYPLAAVAGSAVLLLQFVTPSTASGAVGAFPALLALAPALLGRWFQDRGTTS